MDKCELDLVEYLAQGCRVTETGFLERWPGDIVQWVVYGGFGRYEHSLTDLLSLVLADYGWADCFSFDLAEAVRAKVVPL